METHARSTSHVQVPRFISQAMEISSWRKVKLCTIKRNNTKFTWKHHGKKQVLSVDSNKKGE